LGEDDDDVDLVFGAKPERVGRSNSHGVTALKLAVNGSPFFHRSRPL